MNTLVLWGGYENNKNNIFFKIFCFVFYYPSFVINTVEHTDFILKDLSNALHLLIMK